jgi:hypothetical protein
MARPDDSDLRQGGKGDNLIRGFDRGPQDFDNQPNQVYPDAEVQMLSGGGDIAGGYSVFELIAEQLDQADRSLSLQHDRVLQLLMQWPVGGGAADNSQSAKLAVENRALKSQIAQLQSVLGMQKQNAQPQEDFQPLPPTTGADVPIPEGGAPEIDGEVAELAKKSSAEKDGRKSMSDDFTVLELWEKDRKDSKKTKRISVGGALKLGNGTDDDVNDFAEKRADSLYDKKLSIEEAEDIAEATNYSEGPLRHVILNPNCKKRTFWDLASMFLVLYDMIMIPFGFFEPEDTTGLKVLSWTTRLFWTADMPMSFLSGYIAKDGTIELRPQMITKRYLKTWFALDCMVVGVDWFELIMSSASDSLGFARLGKASRFFRILRLLRLLRLAKVNEIVQLMAEKLPSEKLVIFVDILKLVVIMLGSGHLIACIWFAVGKAGPADKNWLNEYDFIDEAIDYQYMMSMRWALSQYAGGMDEVTPISLSEHMFAAVCFISCFWSGTVFLSILTSHMTQLYILGNQQSQQLNVMRRYLTVNGISKGLALRVTRNAQHAMKMRQRETPESAVGLVDLVSEPLRVELHFEMYFPVLGHHPFFAEYNKQAPHVVRKICHSALSTTTNHHGDIIFHFGESCDRMRMLKSGQLKYTWPRKDENETVNIEEGTWISEGPLWTEWVHRGVLTAADDSVIFNLTAEIFHKIVADFKLLCFDPSDYAQEFVERLNEAEEVTDLPLPDLLGDDKHHHLPWLFKGIGGAANAAHGLGHSAHNTRFHKTGTNTSLQGNNVRQVGEREEATAASVIEEVSESEDEGGVAKIQPTTDTYTSTSPKTDRRVTWTDEDAEPKTTRPMTPERRFHQGPTSRPTSQGSATRPTSHGSARPASQGSDMSISPVDTFGFAQNAVNESAVQPYAAPAAGNVRLPAQSKQQQDLDPNMHKVHGMEPGQSPQITAIPNTMPGENHTEWAVIDEEV